MAEAVESQAGTAGDEGCLLVADELYEAAAELRKTCATCRLFTHNARTEESSTKNIPYVYCIRMSQDLPMDGSGFCHRWEAK